LRWRTTWHRRWPPPTPAGAGPPSQPAPRMSVHCSHPWRWRSRRPQVRRPRRHRPQSAPARHVARRRFAEARGLYVCRSLPPPTHGSGVHAQEGAGHGEHGSDLVGAPPGQGSDSASDCARRECTRRANRYTRCWSRSSAATTAATRDTTTSGGHPVEDPDALDRLKRCPGEPFSQRGMRVQLEANEQASIRLAERPRPDEIGWRIEAGVLRARWRRFALTGNRVQSFPTAPALGVPDSMRPTRCLSAAFASIDGRMSAPPEYSATAPGEFAGRAAGRSRPAATGRSPGPRPRRGGSKC
jgi:hypothetical protein